MTAETFKALLVSELPDGEFARELVTRQITDLPAGEVLIRVHNSSLNYKDALSATGHRGVTKHYPHTPGIDGAGVVAESTSALWKAGDQVLVTGYDLGQDTAGGFAEFIRVPAEWVVRKPATLTLRECMIYGTAGFTAGQSLARLIQAGVTPAAGEILVTGATGGVGSIAVAIAAKAGYTIVAATGKLAEKEFLKKLGAHEVLSRDKVTDVTGKPLLPERWAGVIDTVGGEILATAIRSTRYRGAVTCCGLVASADLRLTVYPFILRGVSLHGIDSARCPMPQRLEIWEKLATVWKPDRLASIASECRLEELSPKIDAILAGKIRGRTVVVTGAT